MLRAPCLIRMKRWKIESNHQSCIINLIHLFHHNVCMIYTINEKKFKICILSRDLQFGFALYEKALCRETTKYQTKPFLRPIFALQKILNIFCVRCILVSQEFKTRLSNIAKETRYYLGQLSLSSHFLRARNNKLVKIRLLWAKRFIQTSRWISREGSHCLEVKNKPSTASETHTINIYSISNQRTPSSGFFHTSIAQNIRGFPIIVLRRSLLVNERWLSWTSSWGYID